MLSLVTDDGMKDYEQNKGDKNYASGGKTGKKSVHATFIIKVVENMCRSRNERIHLQVCGIEF